VARGIVPPDPILADGRLHRCDAAGPRGRGDAAYLLHLDGVPAGGMENWRDGRGWETWRPDASQSLTPAQREASVRLIQAARAERDAEAAQRHGHARRVAARVWANAQPAPANHPYLARKRVAAHGLRVYRGVLVVPVRDLAGNLHSLQFIGATGAKRFLQGGRIQGMCCWLSEPLDPPGPDPLTICLAEGFATGASLNQAAGHPVLIAFHAGNLAAMALAMRGRYPSAHIIVCADDDHRTPGNPGLTQAEDAARKVSCSVARPDFGADRPDDATDFNDMHRLHGLSAVLTALDRAVATAHLPGQSSHIAGEPPKLAWPEPEPLTAQGESQPYPVGALPPLLRYAVVEAQSFVQSPAALVACSALSALSLAGQGLTNVRRDHQLVGPVSIYILAVAESGERKSTCDRIFGAALRDWERDQANACAPDIAAHETAVATAEAKRAGLLEAIKRKRRDMQETADEEAALQALARSAPKPVKVPRLLYTDATPEALSYALATGWPSAAVLSAEAGAVFGAHGMGFEAILRNLALLNVLWDGGANRYRPAEQRVLPPAGPPTDLRCDGAARSHALLHRASGHPAPRKRLHCPLSDRLAGEHAGPPALPACAGRDASSRRIQSADPALLDTPLITDAQGGLVPTVLDMSPSAHAAWVQAYDAIERELASGGSYARFATWPRRRRRTSRGWQPSFTCSTTAWPAPSTGQLRGKRRADRAVASAGSTAPLGDLDVPPTMAAAIRLDAWLRDEAMRTGMVGYRPRGSTGLAPVACATTRL
jgi:putative DNA primase/helicase